VWLKNQVGCKCYDARQCLSAEGLKILKDNVVVGYQNSPGYFKSSGKT
jgi:hypothetical protein